MSHVTTIEAEVNDLAALKTAAERIGGELIEGKKSYKWFGRFMGDAPLPADTKVEDLGKCDHAIRFKGASYEVGVVKKKDGKGYKLQFDYWSGDRLGAIVGGPAAPKLVQAYGVERLKAEAKRRRMPVRESRLADGTIRLRVRGR